MSESITHGIRRFIEHARSLGYEPIETMSDGSGVTTLVYTSGKTYFLVFQRQYEGQKIPRRVVTKIIRGKDLVAAYKEGEKSVRQEMSAGFMTPFVSKEFEKRADFAVYLDKKSFEGCDYLTFPSDKNEDGFGLPAYVVRQLLASLYGEKVHSDVDFF